MRQAPELAPMCMIGPAAVDKPVNIGGRIEFALADQRLVLSTETRRRAMSGRDRPGIAENAQGAGGGVDDAEPALKLLGQAHDNP